MALRTAHIYLPKDNTGFLNDLREKFDVGDGQFQTSLGALLLLMTNVVCVNISGVAMFLYQGVRPKSWWAAEKAKKQTRIAIAIWMTLLTILSILIHLEFK